MTGLRLSLGLGLIPAGARPQPTTPPVNIVAPSIAGVLTQGQTLTADPGAWSQLPVPAFAYQWKRSGLDIVGAAGSTYVPDAADVAAGAGALTVTVTATNSEGSTPADSAGVTIAAALSITGTPGAATVGSPYSFTPTTSGGHAPYSYALTGALPSGLSFSTTTGAISGTPTTSGTATGLDITVTDSDGLNDTLGAFSIVVSPSSSTSKMLLGIGSPSSNTISDFTNVSIYGPLGCHNPINQNTLVQTDESQRQMIHKGAAVFDMARFWSNQNTANITLTWQTRIDGADGNLVVAIPPAGAGVYSDVTHSDAIADGDTFSWRLHAPTGTGFAVIVGGTLQATFANANDGGQQMAAMSSAGVNYFTADRFIGLGGYGNHISTESTQTTKLLQAGALDNLQTYLTAAATSGKSMVSRVNGADGNLVIPLDAGTGLLTDVTHSDVVADGDLICIGLHGAGGTGTPAVLSAALRFFGGAADLTQFHSTGLGPVSGNGSAAYFSFFNHVRRNNVNGESQVPVAVDGVASRMSINAVTNSSGASIDFTLMKDGSTSGVNQVVVLPNGLTAGWITDETHTDTITAGTRVSVTVGTDFTSSASITGLNMLFEAA